MDNNVFVGIVVGLVVVVMYNCFFGVKLLMVLLFFSGKCLVFIMLVILMLVILVVLFFFWLVVYNGLVVFGKGIFSLGFVGVGLYGFFN